MSGQDNSDNYSEDARINNYRQHPSEGTEMVGLGATDSSTLLASTSDASLTTEAKLTLNAAAATEPPASSAAQVNVPPSSSTSSATATSSSPLSPQQLIQHQQQQHQQQQQQPQLPVTSPNLKAMSPQPLQAPPLIQYGSSGSSVGGAALAGVGGGGGVSDLKLRRFLEHNQRLREQLEMRRIPVSEAGRG